MQGVSTCHPTVHIWRSRTTLWSQFSPSTLPGFWKAWPAIAVSTEAMLPALQLSYTPARSSIASLSINPHCPPMGMEHLKSSTWCKSYIFPPVLFVSGMAFPWLWTAEGDGFCRAHSLWWRGGSHPTTIEAHSRQKVHTWSKKEENGFKLLRPYLGQGLLGVSYPS